MKETTDRPDDSSTQKLICPSCNFAFGVNKYDPEQTPQFCVFCGASLGQNKEKSQDGLSTPAISSTNISTVGSVTLIPGHVPGSEGVQFTMGPYQVLSSIGKGGMGEVFLAYDTTCGRRIALKKIRSDLMEHFQMHNRFLKEARITSQLTHPSIIPIYAIHGEGNLIYYTMPFVEGETLKQILRKARALEKKGEKVDQAIGGIPALVRMFLSICQAVAYAHVKGVLHRDIKPENIIVGKYGEVMILDWGLAKLMRGGKQKNEEGIEGIPNASESHPLHGITNIGRVVGTVSYMAPERALGQPATFQTDVYSLGVILYQILTLRYPFKRGSLKEFRQNMHKEFLYDPAEVAPYRDVPRILAQIAMKCLSKDLSQRYQTVDELIHDIESYIEGRSEWFPAAELDINAKSHWEFQENVLIAEHIAITRGTEVTDWVSLMISKESFNQNTKIEANVRIGEKGHGLGFLLSIPEAAEREHLNDGYCLWLGSDLSRSTKLLRSTVEVMHSPDIYLKRNEWYKIRIEKVDNNLHFYLNDALQFSYISHLPLVGTHIGLLSRDADFAIGPLKVWVGGQNVTVNCLAVPDAFLAHKDYITALSEYRRIGYSFPGRAEGREAMFRAGITLLEQARSTTTPGHREKLYEQSLLEFEKLHLTPGAPLEYLGKGLVYSSIHDYEEEIKCFELALRRYPNHPLLPVLKEQIVYRMHESSRYHRRSTYNFILLVVRHLPEVTKNNTARKLFSSLEKHWEPLYFIEEEPACISSEQLKELFFGTQLAFWLAKPFTLIEIIDHTISLDKPSMIIIANALFCLIEIGAWQLAQNKIPEIREKFKDSPVDQRSLDLLEIAILVHDKGVKQAIQAFLQRPPSQLSKQENRAALHILEQALKNNETAQIYPFANYLLEHELSSLEGLLVNCARIWAFLIDKNWNAAGEILQGYPLELLSQETTPLHFLYGCWLYVTEGKEIATIHFFGILDVSYPRSWSLFGHYYNGRIVENQGWFLKAFMWEKRQLYKQIPLFYHCIGDKEKEQHYKHLENQEYVNITG